MVDNKAKTNAPLIIELVIGSIKELINLYNNHPWPMFLITIPMIIYLLNQTIDNFDKKILSALPPVVDQVVDFHRQTPAETEDQNTVNFLLAQSRLDTQSSRVLLAKYTIFEGNIYIEPYRESTSILLSPVTIGLYRVELSSSYYERYRTHLRRECYLFDASIDNADEEMKSDLLSSGVTYAWSCPVILPNGSLYGYLALEFDRVPEYDIVGPSRLIADRISIYLEESHE